LNGSVEFINIKGAGTLPEEEILKKAELENGLHRRELLAGGYLERVIEHPQIKKAALTGVNWQGIEIEVEKREPRVMLLKEGEYWLADGEGVIIEKANLDKEEDYLIITGLEKLNEIKAGKKLLKTEYGKAVQDIFTLAAEWDRLPVAELNLSSLDNVKAYTYNGMEIWLGDGRNLSDKVELVRRGLLYISFEDDPGIVDMRYDDRFIVSPR